MTKSRYIKQIAIEETDEDIEVHQCPHCNGVFGIDATFTDQVGDDIICMMCYKQVVLADPE